MKADLLMRYVALLFISLLMLGCGQNNELIGSRAEEIIKSPNDDRQYRHVQLENGLDVVLISDPAADKAAAALDVYVGSYQNPSDREGLAHFLEHMLFLGTEKYPEPGEYQKFIDEHGGTHNAGTGLEHTTYFFDVDAVYLEPTLDRFSQFFVAPKFDAQYVDREKNAVESEYQLKLKDDGRREWDVLQEQVDPQHPMSKFTVGNLETLADREASAVRDEMLDFYQRYYSANLMKLVVLGNNSLDELEALVQPRFSAIKNRRSSVAAHTPQMIEAERLPLQIDVVPLQDSRVLSFNFLIPRQLPYWRKKPAAYLGSLIGHESEGSLIHVLKGKGWADSLGTGVGLEDRASALFSVEIKLTPEGLNHSEEIAAMLFAWIDLIAREGVEEWRYREQAQLAQIDFQFAEKQPAMGYVAGVASAMQEYPVAHVLDAGARMETFDAGLIRELAGYLVPQNLFVQRTDPAAATDRQSRRYQTPYAVSNYDAGAVAKRQSAQAYGLTLPVQNPYIPDDLSLLASAANSDLPQRLNNAANVAVWHAPDTRFGVPKAQVLVSLESAGLASLEGNALAALYLDYVTDLLSGQAYPASEAGLDFALSRSSKSLDVAIGGYSDKQAQLLQQVVNALAAPQWDEQRFMRVRESRVRELGNFRQQYPFRQVISGLGSALSGSWTPLQQRPVVEGITMPALQEFVQKLLSQVRINLLVVGNQDADSVGEFASILQSAFPPSSQQPVVSVARLAEGEVVVEVPLDHSDSVSALYLQGRDDSLRERARLSLLGEALSAPFYTSLRTEKQLGYVVVATAYHQFRVPGLLLLAQSPVADTAKLREEYLAFIERFADEVAALGESDLQRFKNSLLTQVLEQPKNLAELGGRFQESILLGYDQFDFRQQLAAAAESVTLDEFREAYREVAAEGRRALWAQSVAQDKQVEDRDLHKDGAYSYSF